MEFTAIRPGVETMILAEEAATVSVIIGASACLLVDTGSSHDRGCQIRQAIAEVTDRLLTTVVLTHGHWDHAFGLGAFADLDTIGAENLMEDLLCLENQQWAGRAGLSLNEMILPATPLSLIAVRDLGGVTVEIAHFGPAHTRSDLIVAVPETSVVLVGDLVESGPPQFDETSSLLGWVRTLDNLKALLKDDTVIIPGHGTPLGAEQLKHFHTGLAMIWIQSEQGYHQGLNEDQVYDQTAQEWPWDRDDIKHGIQAAYRELTNPPQGMSR